MSRALCLDLSRTVSRAGRIATGIDRVELAYLREFLTRDQPIFGLVRTALGTVIVDRRGMEAVQTRAISGDWGRPDLAGHLSRKLNRDQAAAQARVREAGIGRATKLRTAALVRRVLPQDTDFYNVGHSNLTHWSLSLPQFGRRSIMIHDTIPLDYPEYQRIGSQDAFRRKFFAAAVHADRLLCNSPQTEEDVQRHASALFDDALRGERTQREELNEGPPDTLVAELGLEPLVPDEAVPLPNGPYFVVLGTIEPRKNHGLLLDIWEGLKDPPTLLIAGSRGWRNDAVFARLDKKPKGIDERSGLSDGQVQTLLRNASGLLFPSHAEGYGLPALEAARLGTPVICSELAVFRHLLGDRAVYVSPNDSYVWEKNIRKLAESSPNQDRPPFDAPTWEAHFKAVLTEIG